MNDEVAANFSNTKKQKHLPLALCYKNAVQKKCLSCKADILVS